MVDVTCKPSKKTLKILDRHIAELLETYERIVLHRHGSSIAAGGVLQAKDHHAIAKRAIKADFVRVAEMSFAAGLAWMEAKKKGDFDV